jgi:hypothetical protein
VDQLTEKECEWFPSPPRKKNEERHPEKSELYADVDGLSPCESSWEGGLSEIMAQQMTDEVHNGDRPIRCIGYEGEQDETKPSKEIMFNTRYSRKNELQVLLFHVQYFADSFCTIN